MTKQMTIERKLKQQEFRQKIIENEYRPQFREFKLDTGQTVTVEHCGTHIKIRLLDSHLGDNLAIIASGGDIYDVGPLYHFINNRSETDRTDE